jgi:hypothetical protein
VDLIFYYYLRETEFKIETTQHFHDMKEYAKNKSIDMSHNQLKKALALPLSFWSSNVPAAA